MARSKSDLYDYAAMLLEAAEAALAEESITLPQHRYVTYELPDLVCCDTLAARHLAPVIKTSGKGGKCVTQWTARVEITVARCVTVFTRDGEMPPLSDVEADALKVYNDRWALMRHMLSKYRCGENVAPCGDPEIEQVVEVNAANCSGSAFTVRLVMP